MGRAWCQGWDRLSVRAASLPLCPPLFRPRPPGSLSEKRLDWIEIDFFNVPADAAFRESKGHPGLELRDDARRHLRVFMKVIIQAIRPRIHQRLEPCGAGLILRLHVGRVDE